LSESSLSWICTRQPFYQLITISFRDLQKTTILPANHHFMQGSAEDNHFTS
jgi:hypothetical protein